MGRRPPLHCLLLAATGAAAGPLDALERLLPKGLFGGLQAEDPGPLPDLAELRRSAHEDSCGRLARLTPASLVEVLKALGYEDAEANPDSFTVALLMDDPHGQTTFHGKVLPEKALATAAPLGRSLSIRTCHGAEGTTAEQHRHFVNVWNSEENPGHAWAAQERAVCLRMDVHLTKYDGANLQVLRHCLASFTQASRAFSGRWLRQLRPLRRRRRRLTGLEALAAHRRTSGQNASEGPLDLAALASRVDAEPAQRLAQPSTDDLVAVLRALGYRHAVARAGALEVLLEDGHSSAQLGNETLQGLAAAQARVEGGHFRIASCNDEANAWPPEARLGFVNAWNAKKRFTTAYWAAGHGFCLASSLELTKYDRGNLELLQRVMSSFEGDGQAFREAWAKEAARRRPAVDIGVEVHVSGGDRRLSFV